MWATVGRERQAHNGIAITGTAQNRPFQPVLAANKDDVAWPDVLGGWLCLDVPQQDIRRIDQTQRDEGGAKEISDHLKRPGPGMG